MKGRGVREGMVVEGRGEGAGSLRLGGVGGGENQGGGGQGLVGG